MMWFDKDNPLALFQDKRQETVEWTCRDSGRAPRERKLEVKPDIVGDFTDMKFPSDTFSLVVFDPPHFDSLGENSRTAQLYGRLFGNWESDLAAGFRECFRVLKPCGVLVFKWNSNDIEVNRVLALSPVPPLFGHTTGRQSKTHWVTFMKPPSCG